MFLKIFLSFWLTIALFAAAQELAARRSRDAEQQTLSAARSIVHDAAAIPAAYEHGGPAAAREAVAAFGRRRGLFADLLNADRSSATGAPVQRQELDAARLADRMAAAGFTQAAVVPAAALAAQRVQTADGERLTLVVGLPRSTTTALSRALLVSSPVRLALILAIAGIVSFVVARHLSAPVVRLSAAARSLADGRLDARAGSRSRRRRDELGALARDFDSMADRLEALVAGERRLLGEVSHELRSPLTRLTVASTLARQEPGAAAEYFDRIEREISRLDRLIEQMLTLARIESGAVVETRQRFDFSAVVDEVVADGDFEARAAGKRVVFGASESVWLQGRAELVRTAVENVVRNAIRHGTGGTAIEVSLEATPDAGAALSVRDHGPGVDPSLLRDIFTPFWKADGEGGVGPDGAGLGLAISERIVRMHGGDIRAANASGGGLLVTISLPVSDVYVAQCSRRNLNTSSAQTDDPK
jgi:two-component system sensor histidine kinase CpxA